MKADKDALIVILGLSDSTERYSNRAYNELKGHGYTNLIGVSPKELQINDIKVVKSLLDIDQDVDTITAYVNPDVMESLKDDIKKLSPRRIIFNPGSANHITEEELEKEGIEIVNGCTLVMLSIKDF